MFLSIAVFAGIGSLLLGKFGKLLSSKLARHSEGLLSANAFGCLGSAVTVGDQEELPLDRNAKGIETDGQSRL